MYKLYLNDIDRISKQCTPLTFICNDKNCNQFKLEEIFSLTALYKDEESFINDIKRHSIDYLGKEALNNELTLVYPYNGIKEMPIIYGDLLLHQESMYKREGLGNHSKILQDFIKFIKSMAINDTTRNFLINPYKVDYLEYYEQRELDLDIAMSDGKKKKMRLKNLLEQYATTKRLYDNAINNKCSTYYYESDLREIEKDIDDYFKGNYKNIVNMLLWEKKYIEILQNQLGNEKISDKQKEIIKLQICKMEIERDCRNKFRTRENIIHYMDEQEYYNGINSRLITEDEDITFENEQIQAYYDNGGIEEVMNFVDLDDMSDEDIKKLT